MKISDQQTPATTKPWENKPNDNSSITYELVPNQSQTSHTHQISPQNTPEPQSAPSNISPYPTQPGLTQRSNHVSPNEPPSSNQRQNMTPEFDDDFDDSDSILTSMTYSSRDWDIGIGDLVFYSLLASQPLTPYFISNHGAYLMDMYGNWIFWIISLFAIIGILIGFTITIKLLERNSMLPGLPLSIALGLAGFLGSALIFSII